MSYDHDHTANPPGQAALAYRAAVHGEFLARMLDGLRAHRLPDGTQPLAALSTRDRDDPAIALLDAWAAVGDVLTFYQERIANEGFLRTATERRSVLELARAVGYELRPGVAAGVHLAFTVEDAPGAPAVVTVPRGARVQSVPRQGQLPQTFETSAELTARAAWNNLRPQLVEPQAVGADVAELRVAGVNSGLRPGDRLLITGGDDAQPCCAAVVGALSVLPTEGVTVIALASRSWSVPPAAPLAQPRAYALRRRAGFLGQNAPRWSSLLTTRAATARDATFRLADYSNAEVRAALAGAGVPIVEPLSSAPAAAPYGGPELSACVPDAEQRVQVAFALLTRTPAPPQGFPRSWDDGDGPSITQDSQGVARAEGWIFLDRSLPELVAGGLALLERPGAQLVCRVIAVVERTVVDYAGSAAVTGLKLEPLHSSSADLDAFTVRASTIALLSEPLTLAAQPVAALVTGERIMLDAPAPELRPGQALALSGQPVDGGPLATEIVVLASLGGVELRLQAPLRRSYLPASVILNANVVAATHGVTVADEVLGSGDGSQTNQRFALRRPPLTYVSAATASGVASTLELRVNGVRWDEVPSLFGQPPHANCYIVRRDEAGATFVIFGDGVHGARLPTGRENVVASYRSGIGLDGELEAGSLTLLQTRPLGIRGVSNPLPATGAAPPETRATARENAPRSATTLGRIVSLRDLERFARSFAGIGKAQAHAGWSSAGQLAYLVIAGAGGGPLDPSSALAANLIAAIKAAGFLQPFVLAGYRERRFSLRARLWIAPRHQAERVVAAVRTALLDAFAFARRDFGQDVSASELISRMQRVPGFAAVDLDALFDSADGAPQSLLRAQPLRFVPGRAAPVEAELLLIDPAGVALNWSYAAAEEATQ